jgi:hypothetical protein
MRRNVVYKMVLLCWLFPHPLLKVVVMVLLIRWFWKSRGKPALL